MIRLLRKARHAIAHWFGWNQGTIETWWAPRPADGRRRLMVGFRCAGCGQLFGVDETFLSKRGHYR